MSTILAFGDSVKLNTGYGNVNRNILWFLSKKHKVTQIGWGHTEPTELYRDNPNLTLVPPLPNDGLSSRTILSAINTLKPDYVFTSNDWFVWQDILPNIPKDHSYKLVSYSIIDGPKAALSYQDIIDKIDIPVVATKYAQNQIKTDLDIDTTLIPHGVNTDKFKVMDKEACKQEFGFDKLFVYGSVNRNNWRKSFPTLLNAFSIVKNKYPDSILFLVTNPLDQAGSNLYEYAKLHDLTISNDLTYIPDVFVHPGYLNHITNLSQDDLVKTYNAFDCYVSASMGEGFGLPHLEAMSCGVPLILPDNSCNSELIGTERGLLYDCVKNKDGSPSLQHSTYHQTSYYLQTPDVTELVDKMIAIRKMDEFRISASMKAREFAKTLDWKVVLPKWNEIIK